MRLQGKVALITGSSSGLGKAVALRMAAEGADVVLNGRDRNKLESVVGEVKALGTRVIGIAADVGSFAETRAMVEQATAELGKVDILVSNAGVFHHAPFMKLSEEDWAHTIRIDLKGFFNCARNVLAQMAARKWGRIIAVTATTGLTGRAEVADICAAKHGVHGAVRALGAEFAPHGITVNAVAPALFDTPILVNFTEEALAASKRRIPMGRIGRPVELAEACCYFASAEAGYVTGSVLSISGGSYV